ncbi:MAG: RNA polymerase sigma factor [Clostridia bacterium]|nr:RNA polymerase sigma factor [Clostridia bacterium]
MDNGASSYRRFLAGDDNAFAEIIREYRDGLILYISSFVCNITEAEDLAEDAFIKLVTKRPRYNGKASFRTWLYTIGGNLAKDYLRKAARRGTLPIEDYEMTPDELELEILVIKNERDIALHRSMGKLKPKYRQILWLVYFEGMSMKDASAVIGIKTHAAENLAYKARQALRAQLEKDGFVYENL